MCNQLRERRELLVEGEDLSAIAAVEQPTTLSGSVRAIAHMEGYAAVLGQPGRTCVWVIRRDPTDALPFSAALSALKDVLAGSLVSYGGPRLLARPAETYDDIVILFGVNDGQFAPIVTIARNFSAEGKLEVWTKRIAG